jgi:hypothetical protein
MIQVTLKPIDRRITIPLLLCMAKCKACDREILFARTANGKWLPIEYNSALPNERYNLETLKEEIKYNPNRHKVHFGSCAKWRKKKRLKMQQTNMNFRETGEKD